MASLTGIPPARKDVVAIAQIRPRELAPLRSCCLFVRIYVFRVRRSQNAGAVRCGVPFRSDPLTLLYILTVLGTASYDCALLECRISRLPEFPSY